MAAALAEKWRGFQFALRGAWGAVLSVLMPARCLTCGAPVLEAACVCVACFGKLNLIDEPLCDVMGTPFAYDQGQDALSAAALRQPPAWARARAAVEFDDASKGLVHAFKYADRNEAGLFMARQMARAGQRLLAEADLIVPVPLHWTRLWKRRFNQAAFLAQHVARAAGKPCALQLLRRVRATPQQVGLDASARLANVRKAFAVDVPAAVKGKCVVLVDDVRTTGATISACVETLKAAGAAKVHVLTFALVNRPLRPEPKA